MFEISKDFAFCAGHRLTGLAAGHKCGRPHGHNYLVRLVVTAGIVTEPPGFIIDYADLAPFGDWLDATFDHRWLGAGPFDGGDGPPAVGFNPTAENLARHLQGWALHNVPALTEGASRFPYPMLAEVGVSETPKTWAWAR